MNKKEMIAMRTNILVGIIMMLLLTLPAAASEYTLEIFGNANEDETINMQDVTYTELIILEYRDRTALADAKYDGEIDILDMTQIALIILGREKEMTLVDSLGREVTVNKPIKRAAVGVRNLLELLRTIQVEKDQLAGITVSGRHPDYNELFLSEYIDLPIVGGSAWSLDCEVILSLNPDVVFIHSASRLDTTQEVLESAGVPVLRFYGGTYLKDLESEMKAMGYIFDKKNEAEEFLDWYASIMNSIKEGVDEISEEDRPKVYYESSHKYYYASGEPGAGVEIAGGKNIFPAGLDVDPEEVVAQDPGVIVKRTGYSGGYFLDADDTAELKEIRDEIMSRPELQGVTAVKTGRVHVTTGYMQSGGPGSSGRGFLQIFYNAKWFHPELFEDLDPKALHQEYLTRFRGLDIDLEEKGVFVYPPLEI